MRDKKKEPRDPDVNTLQAQLEELQQQLEALQAEKDDLFGKLQRVSADYANFQRRVPKQISDSVTYEKENIIKTLLPTLDNFEHMLQKSHAAESADSIIKGMEIIYAQMVDVLKAHGVQQIQSLDEEFDPTQHEAMLRKEEPDRADHVILEEFLKGYRLNDRVIRPSKVVVNRVPDEGTQTEVTQSEEAGQEAQNEDEAASEHETKTE